MDKESIRTIDLRRIFYLFTAIAFFFITEFGRQVYRPFIYKNEIFDFGIADSIGNLGGIVVQIFFSLVILNSQKNKVFNVIGFIVIGYIFYEIIQPILPRGVFDWKDIYGTFIGGFISVIILLIIEKIIPEKVIFKIK